MVKKIIITGGLGYIGTELCKIYSGVSWHHKIIVIDNRFVSNASWMNVFVECLLIQKVNKENNHELV